ncbi:hypothetical protein [Actinomyces succiniciruminis]|uniref:Uncharacterized protein n=1 Tax=Actinomyces succiniciruminis TaxID=1522002 RepID=A0A1L7RK26_9ACTO|nr:hypothetical protein [Actinomyces succiniciruminis]CED90390.1 Hypothetical protein AAM4_0495 [Actinomyces succiniciruminis]
MGQDNTLSAGNLATVAALGTAGITALPHLPLPLDGSIHLDSLLTVRILLLADTAWALAASIIGGLLLERRGSVERGLRVAHVVAYAFFIPAGVVCVHVFAGYAFDAALAQTLLAVVVGVLLSLLRGGSNTMPQGGRSWGDRGEKLGGGLRY